MSRISLVAVVAWAGCLCIGESAPAQIDLEALAARARVSHADAPRKILAFYYPWYGNPDGPGGQGRWMHWEHVNAPRQTIGSSTHWPTLGPYDSHDPATIRQHAQWSRQAGIDGWIVSWWGRASYSDRAMPPILNIAQQAGLQVTAYYETAPRQKTPEAVAADLVSLLERFGDHPAWLRVGDKPVVFVYGRAVGQLGLLDWAKTIELVNRDYAAGAVIQGDQLSPSAARVFDGIHTYNTAGMLRDKSPEQARAWCQTAYPAWVALADERARISSLTVIPGYDDTKIRTPGLAVQRFDGRLYQAQWETALQADPDWVLITSFNEWHEGSEIEPSAEFGEQFLEATARYAARFKAAGKRASRPAASQVGQLDAAEKRRQLDALGQWPIGLLPEGDLAPVWPLLDRQPPLQTLTAETVAALQAGDARRLPALLYSGQESYRRTAVSPGDVEQGLLRYLRAGGCLLVLPGGPMPFYYDERGRTVASSQALGLPLSVSGSRGGWETPPANVQLTFVVSRDALPHLPASFPFPQTGDQRWRPLVPQQLAAGDVLVPLIELKDAAGSSYGLAAAYVQHIESEPRGAKLLYAWFGLLDMPLAETLLYDLYGFLGRQLTRDRQP